jgi:hydroxyacylglutathione hydrolase
LKLKDDLGLRVIGGKNETFPGVAGSTVLVSEGDVIKVGNLKVDVIDVPCHTWGSVAFKAQNLIFVGDFLFSGGAGRFFEGGAADFVKSRQKLDALPEDTLIFPGHEYTVSNLEFASRIDPLNEVRACFEF